MLPDWVFRAGWGIPGVYGYLQLRMEAAQLGTSRTEARKARKALETQVANLKRPADSSPLRWAIKTSVPAGAAGQGARGGRQDPRGAEGHGEGHGRGLDGLATGAQPAEVRDQREARPLQGSRRVSSGPGARREGRAGLPGPDGEGARRT